MAAALFGGTGADWAGPGTGVAGRAAARKAEVIDRGLARHRDALDDPGNPALPGRPRTRGHRGAVIAARIARVPVLLDGFAGTAAAAVAARHRRPTRSIIASSAHCSAEPGHRRLLEKIGKKPLLDLGMRLGEASGAALAIPIAGARGTCHTGMATFAEAGVSGKV